MHTSLAGRAAIVTGASSGLGWTFARALAHAGARVVVAARRRERLADLVQEIELAGGAAVAIGCDVTDAAQVEALVAESTTRVGRVDVLVNAAGVVAEGGLAPEKVPAALFEQTLRVNVLGTWFACQAAASRMLADGRGGSIVNVASIAGLNGVRHFPPAYQASKAAVINLTRSLACSWGDRGVRVNALAPGWFPTEMTESVFAIPAFKAWAAASAALGRLGDPQELAGALLFLASDASRFVTGHTLVVDGGLSAGGGLSVPDEALAIFAEHVPHGLGRPIGKS